MTICNHVTTVIREIFAGLNSHGFHPLKFFTGKLLWCLTFKTQIANQLQNIPESGIQHIVICTEVWLGNIDKLELMMENHMKLLEAIILA